MAPKKKASTKPDFDSFKKKGKKSAVKRTPMKKGGKK